MEAYELLANCRNLTLGGVDEDGNLEWIGTYQQWVAAEEEKKNILHLYEVRKRSVRYGNKETWDYYENKTLSLTTTPPKTDKETIDEDCPEHGSSELAKAAFWEKPWTAHWGCKCKKSTTNPDKTTEV